MRGRNWRRKNRNKERPEHVRLWVEWVIKDVDRTAMDCRDYFAAIMDRMKLRRPDSVYRENREGFIWKTEEREKEIEKMITWPLVILAFVYWTYCAYATGKAQGLMDRMNEHENAEE